MRSMGDPAYRYTPWSQERRMEASAREKARLAAKAGATPVFVPPAESKVPAIDVDKMLNDVRREWSALHRALDHLEEFMCAARFLSRTFPDRADEIEKMVSNYEKQVWGS